MLSREQIKKVLTIILKGEDLISCYRYYITSFKDEKINQMNDDRSSFLNLNKSLEKELNNCSEEEIDFIKKIGLYNYIGERGNNLLNEIVAQNSLEKQKIIKDLEENKSILQDKIRKVKFFIEIFNFFPENIDNTDDLNEDEGLLSLHFQKEYNILGLKQLEDISKKWNDLIRVLYELEIETPPENIQFKEIKKGSLKVYIPLGIAMLKTFGKIIDWSINNVEKYYSIQKIREEIEILKIEKETKKIMLEALEKDAEDKKENDILKITKMISEYLKEQGKEITGELENKISMLLLPELLNFLEKGGEISVRTNEITENEKEVFELYKDINIKLFYKEDQKLIENKEID